MNIDEWDGADGADAPGNVSDIVIEQALQPMNVASAAVAVPTQAEGATSHSSVDTVNDAGQPVNDAASPATQQAESEAPPRRPAFRARPLIEDIVTPDNVRGRRPLPELADLPQNPRMSGPRRGGKRTHRPSR